MIASKLFFGVTQIFVLENIILIKQKSDLSPFITKQIFSSTQLCLGPERILEIVKSEHELRPGVVVVALFHVDVDDIAIFFTDASHQFDVDSGGCDGRESEVKDGEEGALAVVLVMVSDDVGSSGVV